MTQLLALLLTGAMSIASMTFPQAAQATAAAPAMSDARPTTDEKRCKASRRRVERQQEVIAGAQARIDREKAARETCKGKRACESLDRALKASQVRSERHAKQLVQFESEAAKACAAVQPPRS